MQQATSQYRVELLWPPHPPLVLAVLSLGRPHHTALDPYASRLVLERQQGVLLLVEEATNRIVARRDLPQPVGAPTSSDSGTEARAAREEDRLA